MVTADMRQYASCRLSHWSKLKQVAVCLQIYIKFGCLFNFLRKFRFPRIWQLFPIAASRTTRRQLLSRAST